MLNRDAFRMTFVVGAATEQTVRLLLGLAQARPELGFSVRRLKCRLDHVAPAALFNLLLALRLPERAPVAVVVEVQVQPLRKMGTVHTLYDLERAPSAES